jgi:AraC-like DNA-binding protein
MEITTQYVDSLLGCWTHSVWRPPPRSGLAAVVESITYFAGTLTFPRERVFPDGRVELVVQLDEPHRLVQGETIETAEPFAPACLTGILSESRVIAAPAGGCRVLALHFQPAGAYALLAAPLSEVTGITVDLREVAGRAAEELVARCHGAASPEEVLHSAASWVAARVAGAPGADPAIVWTAAEIARHAGAVPIAALRERTGLTRTRLATRFREQIGVSPKHYARLLRFQHVLARLREGRGAGQETLAGIALDAGYYDQPHMNGEFRALAGFSPREFLAGRHYPGSASLAEPGG